MTYTQITATKKKNQLPCISYGYMAKDVQKGK